MGSCFGEILKRKRTTVGRGSDDRLKCTEEGARSFAASKFLR
jgi:hypothetical protein